MNDGSPMATPINMTHASHSLAQFSSSDCLFVRTISALFFALIILMAIIGNLLVIISVCRFRFLRSNSSNCLICSLAFADLIVGSVLMPLKAFNEVYNLGHWNYGYRLCVAWLFLAILCSTASSFHLLCIAIDRYLAINYPHSYNQSKSGTNNRRNEQQLLRWPSSGIRLSVMIGFSWAISFLIALLPLTVWIDEQHFRARIDKRICFPSQRVLYKVFSQIVLFYLPLICMLPMYWSIYQKSKRQCNESSSGSNNNIVSKRQQTVKSPNDKSSSSVSIDHQCHDQQLTSSAQVRRPSAKTRREYRVAQTLVTVLLAYIFFLAPFYLTTLTSAILGLKSPPKLLYSLALWTLYCNSAVNPIIYAFLNRNFARAFKQLLGIK